MKTDNISINKTLKIPRIDIFKQSDFFKRITDFNKKTLNDLYANQSIRKNFDVSFVNQNLGNISSHLIYKTIYDPDFIYQDPNNFLNHLNAIRKIYDITFEREINKVPEFFENDEASIALFNNADIDELESFLVNLPNNYPRTIKYQYSYTQPMLNKKFMGPTKLLFNDKYTITIVSPTTIIAEILSQPSGFMFMDTFNNTSQYIFTSEIYYNEVNEKVEFETNAIFNFAQNFVKDCWLRNKIKSDGLKENENFMKTFMLPNISTALNKSQMQYENKLTHIINKIGETRIITESNVEEDFRANVSFNWRKNRDFEDKVVPKYNKLVIIAFIILVLGVAYIEKIDPIRTLIYFLLIGLIYNLYHYIAITMMITRNTLNKYYY